MSGDGETPAAVPAAPPPPTTASPDEESCLTSIMSYVGGHQDVDGAPLLTPGAERSEGHVDPTGGRRRSGSAALGGPRLVLEVLLALVPVLDLATDVIVVVTVVEVGRRYAGRERLDALRHAVEGFYKII